MRFLVKCHCPVRVPRPSSLTSVSFPICPCPVDFPSCHSPISMLHVTTIMFTQFTEAYAVYIATISSRLFYLLSVECGSKRRFLPKIVQLLCLFPHSIIRRVPKKVN